MQRKEGSKTASILREAEIFVMPEVKERLKEREGERSREKKKGRMEVKDKCAEEGRIQDRIYT